MALNCIVDDSALLAGLCEQNTDNLQQWVRDGAISLFVPLYTLEKLNTLRGSQAPTNLNARKTLEWLAHITSVPDSGNTAGRVELQGPDDQYMTWREVEKYLLPDTPLSSSRIDTLDGLSQQVAAQFTLNGSRHGATALRDASDSGQSHSSSSSPDMPYASLDGGQHGTHTRNASHASSKSQAHGKAAGGTAGITQSVRPLLNYVVWRTYNADQSVARTGKYILLTNDRNTQKLAQKFGVRAKLLSQLNAIVKKSSIPSKVNGSAHEIHSAVSMPTPEVADGDTADREDAMEDDEEEIVYNPAMRPGSSRGPPLPANVMDPNHFGRRGPVTPVPVRSPTISHAVVASKPSPRGAGSAFVSNGAARGHTGSPRGRGQFLPRGGLRGGPNMRGHISQTDHARAIDPDSYARPAPAIRGGRGGMRRLFDPNT